MLNDLFTFDVVVETDDGPRSLTMSKGIVRQLVRGLYHAECAQSINPDEKVQADLAAELVQGLLSPEEKPL